MSTLLQSQWMQDAGVAHGFTTRATGDFARGRPLQSPELPQHLFLLEQVHGVVVRALRGGDTTDAVAAERGDALLAHAGAIGVRVADCVPLLAFDPAGGMIAAVHAGWRGLAAGVATRALRNFGPESVVALGPSIGPCCFEVDAHVADTIAASSDSSCVHLAPDPTKRMVDLRTALEVQLAGLGLRRVERVGGCSRCDAERFHSYRRDGAASGRMLAFIAK